MSDKNLTRRLELARLEVDDLDAALATNQRTIDDLTANGLGLAETSIPDLAAGRVVADHAAALSGARTARVELERRQQAAVDALLVLRQEQVRGAVAPALAQLKEAGAKLAAESARCASLAAQYNAQRAELQDAYQRVLLNTEISDLPSAHDYRYLVFVQAWARFEGEPTEFEKFLAQPRMVTAMAPDGTVTTVTKDSIKPQKNAVVEWLGRVAPNIGRPQLDLSRGR